MTALPVRTSWHALRRHHEDVKTLHLRDLFAADPARGELLAASAAGLYLDYSKNRITLETMRLLLELARECGLRDSIAAMFRGKRVNFSEDRSALHVALRMPRNRSLLLDGRDVVAEVHRVLDRM